MFPYRIEGQHLTEKVHRLGGGVLRECVQRGKGWCLVRLSTNVRPRRRTSVLHVLCHRSAQQVSHQIELG